MDWAEVVIRTTTQGADGMAEVLMEFDVTGVSIEDHADVEQKTFSKTFKKVVDKEIELW